MCWLHVQALFVWKRFRLSGHSVTAPKYRRSMSSPMDDLARRNEERLLAQDRDAVTQLPLASFPQRSVTGLVPGPLAFVDFGDTVFNCADLSHVSIWNSVFRGVAYDSSFGKAKMYDSTLHSLRPTTELFLGCSMDIAAASLRLSGPVGL